MNVPVSYVPGFSHDVFISYAHRDDPDWLHAFQEALSRSVSGRLGQEVRVWQDVKRLRVGNDWRNEIAEAISSTAVFLAVLSPSYQNSDWCSRELNTFIGPDGNLDPLKVGALYRLLKAVKIPWENDDHENFIRQIQHVEFFRRIDDPREYLEINGDAFAVAVQQIGASLTALLRTMRRQLQKVFIASPADEMLTVWERLRSQLNADRYDVRPAARLNAAYDDSIIRREVESAVLSIHLFGPDYDKFAERQLKIAIESGSRLFVWFSPATADRQNVASQQWHFLDGIRRNASNTDWFTGTVQEMIAQVQSALRPKPTQAPAVEAVGSRVYLIHDRTSPWDAQFAASLQSELGKSEKFQVVFPPTGESPVSGLRELHREQLQSCDGVLLYHSEAPESWLEQYVPDVLYQGRKARAKSRAFLLDDPSLLANSSVPVIRRSPDFRLGDLEPFLKPLRSPQDLNAGH